MAYVPSSSSASPQGRKLSAASKPVVYFIGLTAALAGLLFGLDVGVIAGAEQLIQKQFGIPNDFIELIVSALLWGAVVGALGSGFCSNRFGRKKTILFSAVIFVLGSLFCATASTPHLLVGARFILGLAVGMASFTAPLYLSEISPQVVRGSLISMYQLMITIGILVAFLSDTYFDQYAVIGGQKGGHWRMMLGVIAVPAALMFLGVLFLPESPRWLFLKGLKDRAVEVFKRMHLDDAEIEAEVQAIEDSVKVKQSGFKMFAESSHFRRAIFLGIGLQIIQQLTFINVLMYYAPRIFGKMGYAAMWTTVILGLTNVLATFIAIAFVDRLGRKPIMYAGFVVMGLAWTAVGILFNMGVENDPSLRGPTVVAILLFIVGFAMSAGPIIWVLCSEIYPLSGRDFGVTCSTATNWITNAIVGGTFLTTLNALGYGNTFLVYGSLNILFIIFFLLYVPETKGVSLEAIEANLLSGKPLKRIGR